jgi:hypothetical protein
MLMQSENQEKSFAVTLQVRDPRTGKPTGKTKTFEGDTGDEVYQQYVKHVGAQKRGKGKRRTPDSESELKSK